MDLQKIETTNLIPSDLKGARAMEDEHCNEQMEISNAKVLAVYSCPSEKPEETHEMRRRGLGRERCGGKTSHQQYGKNGAARGPFSYSISQLPPPAPRPLNHLQPGRLSPLVVHRVRSEKSRGIRAG